MIERDRSYNFFHIFFDIRGGFVVTILIYSHRDFFADDFFQRVQAFSHAFQARGFIFLFQITRIQKQLRVFTKQIHPLADQTIDFFFFDFAYFLFFFLRQTIHFIFIIIRTYFIQSVQLDFRQSRIVYDILDHAIPRVRIFFHHFNATHYFFNIFAFLQCQLCLGARHNIKIRKF